MADPVSEFLAREQNALADLDDDFDAPVGAGAGAGANNPPGRLQRALLFTAYL